MENESVRMSDIAKELGISTAAVSKAFAGKKGVSDQLREKILKTAEEMGYRSLSRSSQEIGETGATIGVIIPETQLDKGGTFFYWKMYQEVVTWAKRNSCFILLEFISDEDMKNRVLPQFIVSNKIDGLILISTPAFHYASFLRNVWKKPMVFLDFYDPRISVDTVLSNSYLGTYTLTDYLFNKGHTRIGFVGTPLSVTSFTDRFQGYSRAMMEHHLPLREDWILRDRDLNNRIPMEADLPKDMPTAFVCSNDYVASRFIRRLNGAGLSVPDDISVVGFDDFLEDGLCSIGITTYSVDMNEMARRAVRSVLRQLNDPENRRGIQIIDGRLIERDSVKAIVP